MRLASYPGGFRLIFSFVVFCISTMRWLPQSPRNLCVVMLLIAVLDASERLRGSDAALPWCGNPINDSHVPASPTFSIPRPALQWLNSSHFSAAACTLSFDQFTDAHSDWLTCYHAPVFNVHTCPRACLRAVHDLFLLNATVYGSSPFAGNSSICLAAIHAGIIDEVEGGAILIDRFYPETWQVTNHRSPSSVPRALSSAAALATWFPRESWKGSLSFGMQSNDVRMLPGSGGPYADNDGAGSGTTSWMVRGRGLQPRQRQRAPFSPRSGHLHAWLYPELQLRANWSTGETAPAFAPVNTKATLNYSLHFVLGGHNQSHYMNDVSRHASRPVCSAWPTYLPNRVGR